VLGGNLGRVYAVSFAPNGKYLVAAGVAGRLQFWDVEKGVPFLYRYHFAPGAWLDLLPDGRFDASPEGMRYLCYTEQDTLNSYTAEELVKEFYAPKAVREVLERYV
jgi:WD40 repeat protein